MSICVQCQKNKTSLACGLCADAVCKYCAHIPGPEDFAFDPQAPAELRHDLYCQTCFNAQVATPLAEYFDLLEKAKNIDVFFKNQGKETRLIRRQEKPLTIAPCADRDEVVMRLAFAAARAGFDAVVDIDLKSEKVRDGSYQKLLWRGTGVPVHAQGRVITNDKSIWHNPN